MRTEITVLFLPLVFSLTAFADSRRERAGQTTEIARRLVLDRIDVIARTGSCRQSFGMENIDLDRLRRTARETLFYNVAGLEGHLRFSEAVGQAASPDETLRALALRVPADAFVLGYLDGDRYLRTKRVVLNRGYFQQADAANGTPRLTTLEEKQSLLLHELLHIALDKDDDDLNRRELCPLRLLSFCPRPRADASAGASD